VIFDGLRPRGRLRSRALVKEPKVPLADEPTGNLDEDTRDEIITLLDTMWQEGGLTMVFATHDSTVARRAADRR
jgi:putative ABC transport system ATP-binding protein